MQRVDRTAVRNTALNIFRSIFPDIFRNLSCTAFINPRYLKKLFLRYIYTVHILEFSEPFIEKLLPPGYLFTIQASAHYLNAARTRDLVVTDSFRHSQRKDQRFKHRRIFLPGSRKYPSGMKIRQSRYLISVYHFQTVICISGLVSRIE